MMHVPKPKFPLQGTTIRTVTYTADEKYSMAQLCKLLSVNPELGNIMAAKMGIERE